MIVLSEGMVFFVGLRYIPPQEAVSDGHRNFFSIFFIIWAHISLGTKQKPFCPGWRLAHVMADNLH